MDDLRKAAEMALEALEDSMYPQKKQFDAIVGLKQALAQEEQEPEAWMGITDNPYCDDADCNNPKGRAMRWHKKLLYLYKQEHAAPKREWVGLTDEEIAEGVKQSWVTKQAFESAVWWAEIKLKEKNT